MNDKMSELKKELKALLEKYKADIRFSCDSSSDWEGIYDECMIISFYDSGEDIEYIIKNQSYFDASDL